MRPFVLLAMFLLLALAAPLHAGEDLYPRTSEADIQQVLNRLQGSSGLYGATRSEMSAFVDMVDAKALAEIVERMHHQLLERGNVEDLDLYSVSAFVRENLTLADTERLLGRQVGQAEFQRGLNAGGNHDSLDSLVQMLMPK